VTTRESIQFDDGLRPGNSLALTAGSDKTDQLKLETASSDRPISGAAYRSFDRDGSRGNWAIAADADPLSADELRRLAKMSLEIRLVWVDKRFAECQRLLDSYWGQYLMIGMDRPSQLPLFRDALVPPKEPPR
jgi:hypothetical protein